MIHTCIYDNIFNSGGYRIHARSVGFPDEYEADILAVSRNFGPGGGQRETTAIRYAPLRNGKYLLSWVQRHPVTYNDEQRAWHTVVNFLLDKQDADALFSHPVSAIAQRVDEIGPKLAQKSGNTITEQVMFFQKDEHTAESQDSNGEIDDCVLMAGAYYCMAGKDERQLFLESEDPYGEMDYIQRWLPFSLRKELSFCIGLQDCSESTGIIFNFPTDISLAQLRETLGENSPISEKDWGGHITANDRKLHDKCNQIMAQLNECKFYLRDMIFAVVTEWAQLQLLATEQLSDGLGELIRYSDQEAWCKMVRKLRLNSSELRELQALIPRKKYTKAVRAEIKKRLNMPSNGKKKTGANEKVTGKETNTGSEDIALKKILWNNVRRLAAVVVMVVAAIALVTFFRQVLVKETVVVEQVVYYCISREAAVDVLKLCGTYLCGVLSACAVIGLIGSFTRKE